MAPPDAKRAAHEKDGPIVLKPSTLPLFLERHDERPDGGGRMRRVFLRGVASRGSALTPPRRGFAECRHTSARKSASTPIAHQAQENFRTIPPVHSDVSAHFESNVPLQNPPYGRVWRNCPTSSNAL